MEPIIARLTHAGANRATAEAEGISVTARTPIFALCRKLAEAGHGDKSLSIVSTATGKTVVEIISIASAALVTVLENDKVGPVFRKYTPFAISSADAED